jgi:hypothetical protein
MVIDPDWVPNWSWPIYKAAKGQYSNLGSSLAEYRATGKMFGQFSRGIYEAWRGYSSLRRFKAKPDLTPCSVVAAELAYSFGVAPLVGDMYSAMEALRLRLENPTVARVVKMVSKDSHPNVTLSDYKSINTRVRVTEKIDLLMTLKPISWVLTIGNPSQWVWELIPFSFVFDWGINIGAFLGDLDALRYIEGVYGTRTERCVFTQTYQLRKTDGFGREVLGSIGKTSWKSHERKIVSTIPLPAAPTWRPSATYKRLYRAFSLLVSVRRPCQQVADVRTMRPPGGRRYTRRNVGKRFVPWRG